MCIYIYISKERWQMDASFHFFFSSLSFSRIVEELGLTNIITPTQARKKWSNLLQKYMVSIYSYVFYISNIFGDHRLSVAF